MEAARAGLDSFSTAALEVCLGQIDALESRRATLRVDWERERGERAADLDVASAQLAGDLDRSPTDRRTRSRSRRDGLRASREDLLAGAGRAAVPDPAAAQLAAQLDAAAARVLRPRGPTRPVPTRLALARERAGRSPVSAADGAERACARRTVDRA